MKKASYITTRIWVLGMCLGCHAGEQEVPWNSFFHAEHRDIVADATGEKCVFRGVSIQGLEFGAFETNPYPGTLGVNYFSPQSNDIVRLADWGFNVVRIPFEWARLVPAYHAGEPVAWQTNYLALLDEAVEWSRQNRVYVILSMHDYLKYWSASNQLVYVDGSPVYQGLLTNTWRAIAAHYCTNKAVAGFEIMNEPVRGHDTNWHAIAQATVRAIRSVDTNHLVVIDGRNYSLPGIWPRDNGTNTFVTDTINPPRIVYAPHIYYGAGGTANTYPEGGTPITGWEYYLRDRLMPVIEWSIANDVPIMVSESGIPNTSGWASVLSNVFANYYAPLGISHIYWAWLDEGKIGTDVNRLVADGYQLAVLRNNLGGTYRPGVFFTPVKHSPLYDGSVVPPWTNLSWWIVGQETIDFSGPANSEGRKTIAVTFTQSWSCVKFYYDYVDTSRYSYLRFAMNTGT